MSDAKRKLGKSQQANPPVLRTIDRTDLLAFIKFAGFEYEIESLTNGNEHIIISGFDDTGDIYCLDISPIKTKGE